MISATRATTSRLGAARGLRDLMARMGHDSERAAMIYQHEAQGADKTITNAIDTHVQAEQAKRDDDEDGRPRSWSPAWLKARTVSDDPRLARSGLGDDPLTCDYAWSG